MQKRHLLVLALLCHFLSISHAQNQSGEDQLSFMLAPLDMSAVSSNTGILIDRMPQYMDLTFFRGKILADSTRLRYESYKLAYGMVRQAHLSPTNLIATDSFIYKMDGYKTSPLVHLSTTLMKYQRFKSNALSSGLLTYSNGQFHNVPNPPSSPYRLDTLVMACIDKISYDTTTVPFIFKPEMLLTNMQAAIANIQVDFGNGTGYQLVNMNSQKNIIYADTGNYNINVKITLTSGEVVYAGTYLKIKNKEENNFRHGLIGQVRMMGGYSTSPDGSHDISGLTSGTGATVSFWHSMNLCMDAKIRKPLIIIEGFDPLGKYDTDDIIDPSLKDKGLLDKRYDLTDNNGDPKSIKQLINEENYDLFYINFTDGKIDIRENAAYVKQAIEWINAEKHMNGSNEKNIVIGASMGGLVGKWALREFELNGEDHETELFMSFDSPMRGANVPLAVQALPLALGKRKILGVIELQDLQGKLKEGLATITSKAARQMIYYYLGDCKEGCTASQLSVEHDEFYNELDSRGELIVPYVALSNGALDGTGMMFGAGAKLIESDQIGYLINAIISGSILGAIVQLDIEVAGWALPGTMENSSTNLIAKHTIEFPEIIGIPLLPFTEKITISNTGFITYDNAPGGLRPFAEIENGQILDEVGWTYKTFCFIPTISSLDLRGVTNPFTTGLANIINTTSSYAPQVRAFDGSTTSSIQFEENQVNQEHVTLNNNLARFLLSNIRKISLPNNTLSNRTFNYGAANFYVPQDGSDPILSTERFINKNLTVLNTGKLWINRNDKIAFTDQVSNPPNSIPKLFEVELFTDFCTAAPITVTAINGGEIHIGDQAVKNTGSLIIPDKTSLIIDNGGIVTVDDLSHITVKNGGTIEIKAGGKLLIKGDGRLTIDKDATLIIHDGADIELEKSMSSPTLIAVPVGSVIDLDGNLFLAGGRVVLKGNGFLRFGPNHTIKSGTGFTTFESLDRNHVAYRVDKAISMNLYNLNIKNAQFYLNDDINFSTKSFDIDGAMLKAEVGQVTTTNGQVYPYGGGNFNAKNILTSELNNTIIEDVSIIIDGISGGSQAGLFINTVTSTTKRRAYNLLVSNAPVVSMSWSTFNTTPPDLIPFGTINPLNKIGAKLEKVGRYKMVNTTFQNFIASNGILGPKAEDKLFIGIYCVDSPTLSLLENSLINNCKNGIYSNEAVNIVMDHSTISNCWQGIFMHGTASSGLVKMLCSSLIDNQIGIYGYDISLAIDGIINQQNTSTVPQNIFRSPLVNYLHFDIVYSKKKETSILARQNYWENPLRYNIKNASGQSIILDQSLPGNGSCGGTNFANCTAASPLFPITQSGIPNEYYSGFCINTNTCSGAPIMEKYWKGYNCLVNGDIEDAIAHFRPLAEESYGNVNYGPYTYCSHMLNEARAWVGGYDQHTGLEIELKYDSIACLLKWSTQQPGAVYTLQKKNNNVWTNIANATNPYPTTSTNFGTYRVNVTKNSCPVFNTDEVLAECDTLCIDLISAVLNDSLVTCVTSLPQALNFNIKIDMRFYDENEPVLYTMVFPIVGVAGINTNNIDYYYQYPQYLGYLFHWTVYTECTTCNNYCDSSIVIMMPLVRRNVATKEGNVSIVKVYPNPFSNIVNIDLPNGNYTIDIEDLSGKKMNQLLLSGSKMTIDNSNLNSGIYILNIKNQHDGMLIHKSKLIKIE